MCARVCVNGKLKIRHAYQRIGFIVLIKTLSGQQSQALIGPRNLIPYHTFISTKQTILLLSSLVQYRCKNVEKLRLVQNFAAIIITGSRKFDHISPILQELGWMTVHKRLIYRDTLLKYLKKFKVSQIYKCLKDLSPRHLGKLFKQRASVHQYPTRQTHDLIIPKCQTSTGQKTFHYRAVKLWNNLDDKIKSIKNIHEFKLELKKHIFSN